MGLRKTFADWRHRFFPEKPLGRRGEDVAARYLRRLGYKMLGRQVILPSGELDLVALDGRTIVFVEVKTRESDQHGDPSEAVNLEKQRRLTRLAVTFLKRHRLHEYPARFDVISITWPPGKKARIEHFINAFDAVGVREFFS